MKLVCLPKLVSKLFCAINLISNTTYVQAKLYSSATCLIHGIKCKMMPSFVYIILIQIINFYLDGIKIAECDIINNMDNMRVSGNEPSCDPHQNQVLSKAKMQRI